MSVDVTQTADDLIEKGMSGNRDEMASRLAVVSAYRLREYWEPFVGSNGRFAEGTTFNLVWSRYAFDRHLRLFLFDAIERIEICLKTQLMIHLGNKDAAWHNPVEVSGDRVFVLLTICRYCLWQIAPQSAWQRRLEELFADYPQVPLSRLGFPDNWRQSPLWR